MRTHFGAAVLVVSVVIVGTAWAKPNHEIALSVEPPQAVTAIVIRSTDGVRSVAVKSGKVLVPPDVPLPWMIGQTRFEPITYTKADLELRRPLLLRELGLLTGSFARSPGVDERYTWLLQQSERDDVQEIDFAPRPDGTFAVPIPAGLYQGAIVGRATATRIRSGILVKPGQATQLGTLATETTATVVLRVTTANGSAPVAGATVRWDPPGEILNAALSRTLYARRWSTTTDSRGRAVVSSVGPLPLSVRWRVEAKGFAPGRSVQLQLADMRAALPDIRLRPEALVVVRALVPKGGDDAFEGASVTIGELQDERRRRFTGIARAELREEDMMFRLPSYGRKRISIASRSGNVLCYTDVDVVAERTVVDLQPQTVDVRGKVSERGKAVADTFVRLDDPDDVATVMAQVLTDGEGEYRLRTYQTGSLRLYTIGRGGAGTLGGHISKTLHAPAGGEYTLDFELPRAGFKLRVVDAKTEAPVHARVQTQLQFPGNRMSMATYDTDKLGQLESTASPEGTAKLFIQARGYRAQAVELPIDAAHAETVVRLEPSPEITGRVVDIHGVPIPRARVTGGYDSELQGQAPFYTDTDSAGRFSLDATPEPGTTFYVAAPRHALGIAYLQPGRENVIVLHPPSAGVVTLMPDNAPPSKVYMVMAAPAGGEMIPLGALDDLADVNGMNPYQLQGSALDGSVVLPEFLGPGSYELFIALRGGAPYIYHRVGTVNAPIGRNVALAYRSR